MRDQPTAPYTIDPASGCWIWQRAISDTGYGSIVVDGRTANAHRVYYELHKGPIPEGLQIDHLCRNRGCVNPAHLEPVTHGENIRRGTSPTAINGAKTHCSHGHEFTEANTYHRPDDGTRVCRACHREANRRKYERKRDAINARRREAYRQKRSA